MKDRRFADKSRFSRIIKVCEQNGFTFFSMVNISTYECNYYAPVREAKQTHLFFHDENQKSIIFCMINTEEVDNLGDYSSLWSFDVAANYNKKDWEKHVRNQTPNIPERFVRKIIDSLAIEKIVGNLDIYCTGRCLGVWKFEGGYPKERWVEPKSFIKAMVQVKTLFEPYLYHKFREINVRVFAPELYFPECYEKFLSKFAVKKLENITKHYTI